MEVKYLYAMHDGALVHADDVRFRKPEYESEFTCVGCGHAMIARTDGDQRRPHFAHSENHSCSGETYLHQAAKRRFVEVFNRCVAQDEPLTIQLWHETQCPGRPNPFYSGCVLSSLRGHESKLFSHDLTKHYRIAGEEQVVGKFRADVLLQHRTKDAGRILIEFACTHQSTEEKIRSGERIIEFQIADEDSFSLFEQVLQADHPDPTDSGQLGTSGVAFYGFRPDTRKISQDDCGCEEMVYRMVILFKSGKLCPKTGTMEDLCREFSSYCDAIDTWRMYFGSEHRYTYSYIKKPNYTETPEDTFKRAAWDIRRSGKPIQNCVLCQHRRKDKYRGRKLYCAAREQAFDNTNEGAACREFLMKPTS